MEIIYNTILVLHVRVRVVAVNSTCTEIQEDRRDDTGRSDDVDDTGRNGDNAVAEAAVDKLSDEVHDGHVDGHDGDEVKKMNGACGEPAAATTAADDDGDDDDVTASEANNSHAPVAVARVRVPADVDGDEDRARVPADVDDGGDDDRVRVPADGDDDDVTASETNNLHVPVAAARIRVPADVDTDEDRARVPADVDDGGDDDRARVPADGDDDDVTASEANNLHAPVAAARVRGPADVDEGDDDGVRAPADDEGDDDPVRVPADDDGDDAGVQTNSTVVCCQFDVCVFACLLVVRYQIQQQ